MDPLVVHVVGARPNFMKAAPVIAALGARGVRQQLVHTGQHYDAALSDVFFRELDLPEPDRNLNVGSGSHAAQTAAIMIAFEQVILETSPRLVVVYGDVNSTIAAALVASNLAVPVAHVEAGLRSFDDRCRRRSTGGSPTCSRNSCSSPPRKVDREPRARKASTTSGSISSATR